VTSSSEHESQPLYAPDIVNSGLIDLLIPGSETALIEFVVASHRRIGPHNLPARKMHRYPPSLCQQTYIPFFAANERRAAIEAPKYKIAMMCFRPVKVLVDTACRLGARRQNGIVFADANDRVNDMKCFPYPIIISVYVNTQQANLSAESGRCNQVVNVLSSDKGGLGS
jgi:hypothetical protein